MIECSRGRARLNVAKVDYEDRLVITGEFPVNSTVT
jgi:hypothetical protein